MQDTEQQVNSLQCWMTCVSRKQERYLNVSSVDGTLASILYLHGRCRNSPSATVLSVYKIRMHLALETLEGDHDK